MQARRALGAKGTASRGCRLSVGKRLRGTSQCTDLPEDLPEIWISEKAEKIGVFAVFLVRPARLELATLGLEIPCSIQLSYGRV